MKNLDAQEIKMSPTKHLPLRNPAALDEFIHPDADDHSAPAGMTSGTEGSKQTMNMFLAAFPDMHVTIEDMIAEGDKVVVRHTFHGTHTGNFQGRHRFFSLLFSFLPLFA